MADKLALRGDELEKAYRFYCFSMKQLKNNTVRLKDAFDKASTRYQLTRRLLQSAPSVRIETASK